MDPSQTKAEIHPGSDQEDHQGRAPDHRVDEIVEVFDAAQHTASFPQPRTYGGYVYSFRHLTSQAGMPYKGCNPDFEETA